MDVKKFGARGEFFVYYIPGTNEYYGVHKVTGDVLPSTKNYKELMADIDDWRKSMSSFLQYELQRNGLRDKDGNPT